MATTRALRTFDRVRMPSGGRSPLTKATATTMSAAASMTSSSAPEANLLRVLQFNTLADGLAQSGGFIKTPPQALEWSYRAPLLVEEILSSKPDVICLQEVNHYEDHFKPQLKGAGYEGIFLPKSSSPATKFGCSPDGCCIFYKTERLQPAGDHTGKYYTNPASGEAYSQGFLVCPLRDASTGALVCVATTHLKAKVGAEEEQARINQARQLMDHLFAPPGPGERAPAADSRHVVLTGDFNTTPDSEVCQILRSNGLESIWDAEAVREVPRRGRDGDGGADVADPRQAQFTTWKFRMEGGKETGVKRIIDYIWFSAGMRPVSRWSQLTEDEIGGGGLPSLNYPSDHIAVCCDLELMQE